MRAKNKIENQLHFLAPTLKEQLNPKDELYLLSHEINWDYFEDEKLNLRWYKIENK